MRHIRNFFFIRLRSRFLSEYGFYLLHIRTWLPMEVGCAVTFATFFLFALKRIFKRIWILFASCWHVLVYSQFANIIYSHHLPNIRLKIFAQIRIQICIRFDAKQLHFLILAKMCFKVFLSKRIFAKL